MQKKDFRRYVNATWIGYNPDRMKTAHIANGLYLQLMGEFFDAEDVNRLSVPANKRGPIPKHKSDLLLNEMPYIENTDIDQFNLARQHIREHLGADSAIFDRHDRAGCAYSAANTFLVTDDNHNDGWAGNFIGLLLQTDFGAGVSPAVQKIQDALNSQNDPLSIILQPFLENPHDAKAFSKYYGDDLGLEDKHHENLFSITGEMRSVLVSMREALDNFTLYYPTFLSKERFTRLFVILSSFTLLRHITTLAQIYTGGTRPPFFVDYIQKTGSRVRFASQLSYIRCLVALNELYVELIKEYIRERVPSQKPNLRMVQEICMEVCENLAEDLLKKSPFDFTTASHDVEELLEEVSRHIMSNLFPSEGQNFMRGFFIDVGIRSGILMPRGSSQPRKHFFLQPDTIEAFTLSCIPYDHIPMTMGEFANELWQRYGIIVGGRPEDIELLYSAAIRDVNQDDLDENYEKFTGMMVSLGLAQRRSDGLVLVHPTQNRGL